jgi:hypothetical protein
VERGMTNLEADAALIANGLVNKVDDDLLSATRILCMDIRRATTTLLGAPATSNIGYGVGRDDGRHNTPEAIAARSDFDVFTGQAPPLSDAIPRISGEAFRYETADRQTQCNTDYDIEGDPWNP